MKLVSSKDELNAGICLSNKRDLKKVISQNNFQNITIFPNVFFKKKVLFNKNDHNILANSYNA